jgi:uncharacterized glyoxalase superfamily protein PhnB
MFRPPLELVVRDVADARRFYAAAFDTGVDTQQGEARIVLGSAILVLRSETASSSSPLYERGKTPRLELVVDDVDLWADRMISAGGEIKLRLPNAAGGARYAQVVDRFGHVWAFASR